MQWNLCITDSKKYSFISTNIIFFLRGISILFADVAVYADVAHIELLAHNQLSPSTHLASQSSLDTHNQAYGLKCNRKSRVLRASKCRTTHNATATRESRGTDDPLKSSKLNFQNGEVKFHQQ